jgi:hypothetical protein
MIDFESNVKSAHEQSMYKKLRLFLTLVAVMGLGYWLGGQDTALRFLELFIGIQLINAIQEIHYLTLRVDQLEKKLGDAVKRLENSLKQLY